MDILTILASIILGITIGFLASEILMFFIVCKKLYGHYRIWEVKYPMIAEFKKKYCKK